MRACLFSLDRCKTHPIQISEWFFLDMKFVHSEMERMWSHPIKIQPMSPAAYDLIQASPLYHVSLSEALSYPIGILDISTVDTNSGHFSHPWSKGLTFLDTHSLLGGEYDEETDTPLRHERSHLTRHQSVFLKTSNYPLKGVFTAT